MKPTNIDDEDEPGFFQRHKVMLIVGVLALGGGGYFYANHKPSKSTPKKKLDMVMVMPVMPPPPPPPPPPPKPPEPEPEEKEEEEVAAEEEPPPDAAPDKPADKPADEPIGTAISGGDGSGLGLGGGTGGGGGGGGGIGGKSYSARGVWQNKYRRGLEDALRKVPELKHAKGRVPYRVWFDDYGRVTRVVLSASTGDPKVDAALENTLRSYPADPLVPGTPMPLRSVFNAQ